MLGGKPPSPIDPPAGCRFHARCLRATDLCRTVEPPTMRLRVTTGLGDSGRHHVTRRYAGVCPPP
ncbi:MAG TPA: oligopeptide/dipeptide ABC transporter ATP-binding protein [Conexibacter sp.]|nr:oligopeptide/dipeptide ABC transporter ATP-binding protein [Conexibacter sp.]